MHSIRRQLRLLPFLFTAPLFAGPLNYVANGGFETGASSGVFSPTIPGYIIYVFGVGGAADIGGWTVSNSPNNNGAPTPLSLVVTGNPPQMPAGGSYALDFDPYWNISTGALLGGPVTGTLPEVSQTFDLPAGSYLLSFDGAVELGSTVGTRSLEVTLSGSASLDRTVTSSEIDTAGYDLFSFDFVSSGGPTTLTFIPDDFSPEPNFMLDNVSVTPLDAPEPSFVVPLLAALLVIGLVHRQGSAAKARRGRRRQW